jgi:nicotinate phosphoribosyltransferase
MPLRPLSPYLEDASAVFAAALAMANGDGDRRVTCELVVPQLPEGPGFLLMAGIEEAGEAIETGMPTYADLHLLRDHASVPEALLRRLSDGPLAVDVDAAPTGSVGFARQPLVTIEGPLAEVLVAVSVVRARIARATAIATRAAHRSIAAGDDGILDDSATRAFDLAEMVARAAHIGGAHATTALVAGTRLGIPVMSLPSSLHSARGPSTDSWGDASTTAADVRDASPLALLVERGAGLRGALAARDLDFPGWLDLRACFVAVERGGAWLARAPSPNSGAFAGRKRTIRYVNANGVPVADVLHASSERIQPAEDVVLLHELGRSAERRLRAARGLPTTLAVLRAGRRLGPSESVGEARKRAAAAVASLTTGVRRLLAPVVHPVGLSPGLAAIHAEASLHAGTTDGENGEAAGL